MIGIRSDLFYPAPRFARGRQAMKLWHGPSPAVRAAMEAIRRGERVCIAHPDGMYIVQKQGRRLLVELRREPYRGLRIRGDDDHPLEDR